MTVQLLRLFSTIYDSRRLENVTSGANPVGLRQGIDKAVKVAVEALHDISQKVENKNEIAQWCYLSCR